jgi:glyoxylase-like metal-dependent hydrolase (beta-lactamase superfamily II)/rhodanese-related sulfurtransferase
MIFRQIFDSGSCTYTYLLASRRGGEAVIIDPVIEKVDRYVQLLAELDLKLVKAIDTHLHADHITGLGRLRDLTRCVTVMGKESEVDVVSMRVTDGDRIDLEGLTLIAMHTPGHTADSYCFRMHDRVFTGDTLLIRGTGRTDFQGGDPAAQYESLFGTLLKLADDTLVYPAHDYKGETVSTIAEERAFNPRLQVACGEEYVALMRGLKLANPKMMDVAVPANLRIGLTQEYLLAKGLAVTVKDAVELCGRSDVILVDLREARERQIHGVIPGALHAPYRDLEASVCEGGVLHALAKGRRLIFYCAFGERSAMAVEVAQAAGITDVAHLHGGLAAWKEAGGPLGAAG